MDSEEGDNEDPQSLHKYLYCQANPVNGIDPSGHEFELGSLATSISIGASIGAVSTFYANQALGRAQTMSSILMGAAWGGVLGPYAAAVPEIGAGLGLLGVYGSGSVAWEVAHNPNATPLQRFDAALLVVGSIWGTKVAMDFAKAAGPQLRVAQATLPQFPLPLKAPPGVELESAQPNLHAEKVGQLPQLIEDMYAGKAIGDAPGGISTPTSARTTIPRIGGSKVGNRYIIREGNTRMTAALEYYKSTGDPKYVYKILETGNWSGKPPSQTWKMTQ